MSITRALRLKQPGPAQPGHSTARHSSAQLRDPWLFNDRCQGWGSETRLLLAGVCVFFFFLQPQRLNHYPGELTWMNVDRGNMGESALYCRSMICDCTPLNRGEMGGHKTLRFPLLRWVDLAYFHFSADVERHIETKPTPGDLLPRPFLMGRNSKRSIFKRTLASLTAFLFMKPGVHQGGLSVVITGGEQGGKLAVISNMDFCCRHGTCGVICSDLKKNSLCLLCGAPYCQRFCPILSFLTIQIL